MTWHGQTPADRNLNSSHDSSHPDPSHPDSFPDSNNMHDQISRMQLNNHSRSGQAEQTLNGEPDNMGTHSPFQQPRDCRLDSHQWGVQSYNEMPLEFQNVPMSTALFGMTGGDNEPDAGFEKYQVRATFSALGTESNVAAPDLHPFSYDAALAGPPHYQSGSVQAASVSSPGENNPIAQQSTSDYDPTYHLQKKEATRSDEWRNNASVDEDMERHPTLYSDIGSMSRFRNPSPTAHQSSAKPCLSRAVLSNPTTPDLGQPSSYTAYSPRENPGALPRAAPWSQLNTRGDHPLMISRENGVRYEYISADSENSSERWHSQRSTDGEWFTGESSVDQVSNGLGESRETLRPLPASGQGNSSRNESLIPSLITNPSCTDVLATSDEQFGRSDNGYESNVQILPSQHPRTFQHPSNPPDTLDLSTTPGCISCRVCNTNFNGQYSKGNLARHRRLKHGGLEGKYSCEGLDCVKTFRRPDARLKHYRKHHPELDFSPFRARK